MIRQLEARKTAKTTPIHEGNIAHLFDLNWAITQALAANNFNPEVQVDEIGRVNDERTLKNGHVLKLFSGHPYGSDEQPWQQAYVGLKLKKADIVRKHLTLLGGTGELKLLNLVVFDPSSFRPWRSSFKDIRVHYPDMETMTEALTSQINLAVTNPTRLFNAHALDLYRDQMQ